MKKRTIVAIAAVAGLVSEEDRQFEVGQAPLNPP